METVLISGASVAGPALAYWLGRHGFQPTVVERAPALRGGGYAVDFRGDTHLTVLERMGVLADLRGVATGGTPITFVDAAGRELLRLPGEFAGGDIEVSRSDLSRVLYEHSRDSTEYVFGDSITTLTETAAGVDVTFTHGAPRTFDLVVGADGVHSAVRRIAFGAHERFVSHLGYYVAGWDLPASEDLGAETLAYNVPGRLASIGRNHREPDRASAFVIFASRRRGHDPYDSDQQRRLIRDALSGMTWRTPELIASLDGAEDLYFDGISRVDISPWSHGRIALVGDAASVPRWAEWAPEPRSSPRTSSRARSPAAPARSPATRARCATTPGAARGAATGPGGSWRRSTGSAPGSATARCGRHGCSPCS